jgi:hypothetical protein
MRVRFLFVLVLASGFLSGCGEAPLQEYTSEEGKFRLKLPGAPEPDDSGAFPERVNKVRLLERSGKYEVAWEDLKNAKGLSDDKLLDDGCDLALKLVKGKLLRRKEITLAGKYPGRELIIGDPDGDYIVHDRMYLVGTRLYNVMASGPKWWVESSQSRKVLDSFEHLE